MRCRRFGDPYVTEFPWVAVNRKPDESFGSYGLRLTIWVPLYVAIYTAGLYGLQVGATHWRWAGVRRRRRPRTFAALRARADPRAPQMFALTYGPPAWASYAGAVAGRLRRGPSVIILPAFSFVWRIPIVAINESDE